MYASKLRIAPRTQWYRRCGDITSPCLLRRRRPRKDARTLFGLGSSACFYPLMNDSGACRCCGSALRFLFLVFRLSGCSQPAARVCVPVGEVSRCSAPNASKVERPRAKDCLRLRAPPRESGRKELQRCDMTRAPYARRRRSAFEWKACPSRYLPSVCVCLRSVSSNSGHCDEERRALEH